MKPEIDPGWFPRTVAELEKLPEAPADVNLWFPIYGQDQVLAVDNMDGSTTYAGMSCGEWFKQTRPAPSPVLT